MVFVLPTNIRLGWKGFARNKPASLHGTLVNYVRNYFYNIGPWPAPGRAQKSKTILKRIASEYHSQ
jgi:hypothetical protein